MIGCEALLSTRDIWCIDRESDPTATSRPAWQHIVTHLNLPMKMSDDEPNDLEEMVDFIRSTRTNEKRK